MKSKSNIIEQYDIRAEGIKNSVRILGGKGKSYNYNLIVPELSPATLALIDTIKNELIIDVHVSGREILDPKIINKLKKRFSERANSLLNEKIPGLRKETKELLIGKLIREMLGLGNIEFLLNDSYIEEIVINSANEPIRIYHKKHGWLETNVEVDSELKIQNYANIIARRVGRQITTLNPLLDAHLITGDRANAVIFPISTKGNTITIRKFARDPWTSTEFISNKTVNAHIMALIWLAMQYEMNIIVSGGTASGKTSMLNVMMPFIPFNHRIISIEDTREIQLPSFLYWCPLVTRQPNPEGKGEITMLDLLVNSLRMRPDRIILGEVRRKRDAEVLFESMHTGHSVYATVHANTVNETIQRLTSPPIEVASNLLQAVHLNVVMFRDRRRGLRRVYQIGEFVVSEESGESIVRPNILYRWKPGTDEIVQHASSLKLFEELSRHTGLSQNEIDKDIRSKEKILKWMVKNKLTKLEDVGKIMKTYYLDSEFIVGAVNKNKKPTTIFNLK